LRYYRDEPVLAALNGRLVPPDERYPDCECEVILTELNFFVVEDNYNGTHTEHFTIPIGDVLCIEGVEEVVLDSGAISHRPEARGLWRILRTVGSVLSAFGDDAYLPSKFVRVRYRADDGREVPLFFSEAGNPSSLSRALEKHREQWGLNYQSPYQTP